jgi:hypothetical protein
MGRPWHRKVREIRRLYPPPLVPGSPRTSATLPAEEGIAHRASEREDYAWSRPPAARVRKRRRLGARLVCVRPPSRQNRTPHRCPARSPARTSVRAWRGSRAERRPALASPLRSHLRSVPAAEAHIRSRHPGLIPAMLRLQPQRILYRPASQRDDRQSRPNCHSWIG